MSRFEAPFDRHRGRVKTEWVDYNGHFNMGYYLVAFDHASEEVTDAGGFTAEGRTASGKTVFVVETHVIYRQEVKPGQAFRITTQVLGVDAKRLHVWHSLYAEGSETPAAFNEVMMICVTRENPAVTSWPEATYAAFKEIAAAHAVLPIPPEAGRKVSMERR